LFRNSDPPERRQPPERKDITGFREIEDHENMGIGEK
jgi:hypothetical protein